MRCHVILIMHFASLYAMLTKRIGSIVYMFEIQGQWLYNRQKHSTKQVAINVYEKQTILWRSRVLTLISVGPSSGSRKRPLSMLQKKTDDIPTYNSHVRCLSSFYFNTIKLLIVIRKLIVKFIYNSLGKEYTLLEIKFNVSHGLYK